MVILYRPDLAVGGQGDGELFPNSCQQMPVGRWLITFFTSAGMYCQAVGSGGFNTQGDIFSKVGCVVTESHFRRDRYMGRYLLANGVNHGVDGIRFFQQGSSAFMTVNGF